MGDLLTYSLSDFVPFIRDVYLQHFVRLNEYVWPATPVALLGGMAALVLAWRGRNRSAGVVLALAWASVGWVYQMHVYATYNWAGTYFGWAFLAQGGLLLAVALLGSDGKPGDDAALDGSGWVGFGLAAVGVAGFPFLAPLSGRAWTGVEIFGIAPNPTVVATLGLGLVANRTDWVLFAVPLSWCVITGATSWVLGTTNGLVTAIAGGIAVVAAIWRAVS